MSGRRNRITVRLNDSELTRMKKKMDELDIYNMSDYMRKMLLDGYCVKINSSSFDEILHLLKICSNNLNQYAKKANGLGQVYSDDIKDLQQRFSELLEVSERVEKIMAVLR